ncbi:threonine/serine dehydratase [Saccharospirillum salsuginis]|uniref:Threonine ammonia-lyase n=1 Tax=Saccharospirillum salsuginis TaxID=418750 RepID=A0A918NCD8_9GAMM|nr:threonine/serine dehydratase [Saccharospirillum salsuginis]GGX57994.1 threonine ammonia-lyase [Saccharospirillum salsuginis]
MEPLPDLNTVRHAEARIRDRVLETPLIPSPDLEREVGQPLWLKLESVQRTGSFKARGALNWMLTASDEELENGLVTVSAGNHALALAWAASERSVPVTVVMPEGSSPLKVEGARALGADVIVQGAIHEAVAHCFHLRDERGLTLVHPYNDPRIMAGQGTVGVELHRQQPMIRRVLCPIGGGGLISGLGLVLKALNPDLELIGVEPVGAATMWNAWQHNDPKASLDKVDTWAASLAPAVVGDNTYRASRQTVDRIVTIDEESIRKAMYLLLTRGHLYAEPGASVGLAALLSGAVAVDPETPTALIISGGNLDPDQVSRCC